MSSFNLGDLSPLEKENNSSFRKYLKNSKQKSTLEPFKEQSNRIMINKTNSLDFSVDFLESIEKCMKSSFIENNNINNNNTNNNDIQTILRNTKKNSYILHNNDPYFDDKDILNNLDSLIQKSNNMGIIQDSLINKFLESKSYEGESPSLNHDQDFVKVSDKKMDQNDTCLYQIEQILKNFEEDDEKKIKLTEEIIEIKPNKELAKNFNEHIMIVNEESKNGKINKNEVNTKKKKIKKCIIF